MKDAESIKVVDAFFKASEANIKTKLDANEISQEEYNTELQSLSNARNTGLKIPSNYSVENKEKAFDLILKRDKLQREVEGLDSALSENQKSEITEINNELKSISDSELVDSRLKKSISFAEKGSTILRHADMSLSWVKSQDKTTMFGKSDSYVFVICLG